MDDYMEHDCTNCHFCDKDKECTHPDRTNISFEQQVHNDVFVSNVSEINDIPHPPIEDCELWQPKVIL